MSSALPKLTLGIAAYRRLEMLQEAARAAAAQAYRPLEVIVCLNPSSEPALDERIIRWGREWEAAQPGIARFEVNATNLGMAGNWNRLADLATGEFVAIQADDDRVLPGFAETLMRACGARTAVAFSNHYVMSAAGARDEAASRRVTRDAGRAELAPGPLAQPERAVWRNSIPICASVIRTSVARRLRFREELNTPEVELFARIAHEGAGELAFVPEYLSEYRLHPGSESSRGLWYEKLIARLEPIAVSADFEPAKQAFLARLTAEAITRALLEGRATDARRLAASPGNTLRPIQVAALRLPVGLGRRLLQVYFFSRRQASRLRAKLT